MKKILLVLLAVILAFSFSACTLNNSEKDLKTEQTPGTVLGINAENDKGIFTYVDGEGKTVKEDCNLFKGKIGDEEVSFYWINHNNYIYCESAINGTAYDIDKIKDNVNNALATRIDNHNNKRYFICNLKENTVTELFGGKLSEYANVDNVDVSSDLSLVSFDADSGNKAYLYDGKKVIELNELIPKEGIKDSGRTTSGIILGKKVVMSYIYKNNNESYVDKYAYDYTTGDITKTIENMPMYSENRKDGLKMYGGRYATVISEDNLRIVDMLSGEFIDTEIKSNLVNSITDADDECFSVVTSEGKTLIIEKSTGKIK